MVRLEDEINVKTLQYNMFPTYTYILDGYNKNTQFELRAIWAVTIR